MRSTGWGSGKGLALTRLASHSGPGAGGLRALCSGFRRVEECDSEECLTRAEIAHFAFFIWGSRFQHRVPLFSHSSLGPQLPRSPTALAFWGQWPLFPVFFDCFYFLTKSCCGNQKMVRTWKRTTGPTSSAPQPALLCILGREAHGAMQSACCLLSGIPSPKASFKSFSQFLLGKSAQPFPAEPRSNLCNGQSV